MGTTKISELFEGRISKIARYNYIMHDLFIALDLVDFKGFMVA